MSLPSDKPNYSVDDWQFWELCYEQGKTPWELGRHAPPLETFLGSPGANSIKPGKIAVLGCGTGHDCMLFLNRGFEVHAIDFAPSALNATRQKFEQAGLLGTKGFVIQKDVFALDEYNGAFDYVLEHTCFCSIDPSRRRRYPMVVRDLLKPTGMFIGLWWMGTRRSGGAPFAFTKDELFALFDPHFTLNLVFEPTDSAPPDQGKELFTVMTLP